MPYGWRWRTVDRWLPTFVRRTVKFRWMRTKVQRANRGFSDEDLWSFDFYIKGVISKALRQFIKDNYAWPGEGSDWPTPEDWDAYLLQISKDLEGWNDDTFLDDGPFLKAKDAMHRFADIFGQVWY